MEIDANTLNQLFLAVIALISAFTAWLASRNSTKINTVVTTQAAQGAKIDVIDSAQTAQMVSTGIPIPNTYKYMSEDSKRWITFDMTPEDKASALKQIGEAEALKIYEYQINVSNGWYLIQGGIPYGSAKTA